MYFRVHLLTEDGIRPCLWLELTRRRLSHVRRRRLVDRLQRRSKQQVRFFVARGPAAFAVDALPRDFEQLVDENHCLWAPAARTGYAMFVEHVMSRQASLHVQLLGSYKWLR